MSVQPIFMLLNTYNFLYWICNIHARDPLTTQDNIQQFLRLKLDIIFLQINNILMERKIDDIIQAFRDHQFDNSLKLIVDLEKKKQKKGKKQKFADPQDILVDILKASCFLKLGRYGEAEETVKALKLPDKLETDFASILICILRDLEIQPLQNQVLSKLESQKQLLQTRQKKGYFVVQYAYINKRRFGEANKFYFNLFNTSKSPIHFFTSIYLQFLDILQKNSCLLQKYNSIISIKEGLDFRMVKMFWEKLLNVRSLDDFLNQKTGQQILKFNIRLLISLKESQKAIQLLEKHQVRLTEYWDSISFYKSIFKQAPERLDSLLKAYLRVFQNNKDLIKYKPALKAYRQFIDLLLQQGKQQVQLDLSLKQQQTFRLSENKEIILSQFLASLKSDYSKKFELADKSADYYKLSLKISLQSIIYILAKTNHPKQREEYLKKYTNLFSNTFTFAEEVFELCPEPYTLLKPENYKNDNSIIFDINFLKLQYLWKVLEIPKNKDSLMQTTNTFKKLYDNSLKQQGVEVLEKGERYLADQYIIILSDIFRQYLSEKEDIEALMNIISILETSLKKSPYNFDIKTKLILWYDRLGNPSRLMQIYETMDIKSSQFQVLGYFFYKQIYSFRLYNQFQQILLKAIRSYHQNEKEIQQYTYNCIQELRHSTIEQFLSYHDFIRRSYSKTILIFLMSRFPKFKSGTNQRTLIKLGLKQLKQKLTWSCDAKILRSTINPLRQYIGYFDAFNSYRMLINELNIREQQLNLMQEKPELQNKVQDFIKVSFEDVLNPNYETIQGTFKYSRSKSVEEKKIEEIFTHSLVLAQLGFSINLFLRAFRKKQETNSSQILGLLQIIKTISNQSHKTMIISQQKIADIIILLNHYVEPLKKKKKKLNQEQQKILSDMQTFIQKCYEVVCSFKGKQLQFQLWTLSQEYVKEYRNNEKQLNNLSCVERREFDKLFKIQ